MGYQVSKNFHSELTERVISSPISFFDTNSIGNILTRFSLDAYTIDSSFQLSMFCMTQQFQRLLSCLGSAMMASYLVSPIVVFYVYACYIIVRKFKQPVSYSRERSGERRSKLNSFFVLFNEGLSSIRATQR